MRWARTDGYDGGDHAGSLGPGLNGLDPSGSILIDGEVVAARVEQIVDPVIGGGEALGLAD